MGTLEAISATRAVEELLSVKVVMSIILLTKPPAGAIGICRNYDNIENKPTHGRDSGGSTFDFQVDSVVVVVIMPISASDGAVREQ